MLADVGDAVAILLGFRTLPRRRAVLALARRRRHGRRRPAPGRRSSASSVTPWRRSTWSWSGAGPAGAAAAIVLARAGRDVVLVDKATFPRDKCCGDGLTAAALRELRVAGPAAGVGARLAGGRRGLRAGARRGGRCAFPLPDDRGQYAVVRPPGPARRRPARRGPGRRGQGPRRPRPHRRPGGRRRRLELDVDGLGPVATRFAIGADGMWSPLRKALGVAPARLPGRLARLPPVLLRRRARRPTACGCGSSPTSSPATPGRSPCPAAGPTSGSGSTATGVSPPAT